MFAISSVSSTGLGCQLTFRKVIYIVLKYESMIFVCDLRFEFAV